MPVVSSRGRQSIPRGSDDAGTSKSLRKAIRILLYMGQNGPEIGITQLASALNLNKTTIYRLLSAMERFDLIEKNPQSEKYRLGLKLHELGCKAVESRTLQTASRRFLVELSQRSNESASLAVPRPGGVVCLDRVDSASTIITVRTPIGGRFPAHSTAAGKAVLAYLPEEQTDFILVQNGLKRFTPSTLTRLSKLKENFRLIRQRGYSLDEQELERGLSGVAVPILLREKQLIAAVGIAGPTPRFQGRELSQKIAMAKESAAKISATLGERDSGFAAT